MTAKNLYEQNFSIEQIAKAIGFDISTVEKWLTPKALQADKMKRNQCTV